MTDLLDKPGKRLASKAKRAAKPKGPAKTKGVAKTKGAGAGLLRSTKKLDQFARACGAVAPWRVLGIKQAEWKRYAEAKKSVPPYVVRSIDAHLRLLSLGGRGEAAFADLVMRSAVSTRQLGSEDEQLSLLAPPEP